MLRRLTDNTTAMFWTLHLGGWAGFALFTYLMGIAAHDKPPDYIMPSIGYALAGTGITYGLRRLYKWIWNLPKIASFLIGGLGVVIAAFAFAAARQFVYLHLYEGFEFGTLSATEYFHPWDTTLSLYLIGTWSGLYFGIKYYRMVQQQREQVLKATSAAHESQLKMLRYQLNPHFLFNTLNAISTLVLEGENDTANRMVSRLSTFLRHSLDRDPMQKITLRKEIEALNLYLTIENIRFEDRLKVLIEIEPEAYTARVPSMILQPLIENAIKYAIHTSEDGGIISIAGIIRDDMLCLSVADNGPGIPGLDQQRAGSGKGVGLTNIRERLQVLYGEQQKFRIENAEPNGLKVTICIPFECNN
jgi:two-component system LytT family sensor kinase